MGLEKNVKRKEKKRKEKGKGKERKAQRQRTGPGCVPTPLPFSHQHTRCRIGTAPIDDAAPLRPGVRINRPVRLSSNAMQRNGNSS
jgi:hypothetical protein